MKKRGQLSMEYMLIMSFALLMTIPLLIIFFEQSSSAKDQINSGRAAQIGREIVDNAERVYYLGEPTTTTLKVNMPENINQIMITSRELTLRIETGSGLTDVTIESAVNLTGSLLAAEGIQNIKIQSAGESVVLSNT